MDTDNAKVAVATYGTTKWITLNNAGARNAYDEEMAYQVADAVDASTDCRSVVITGSPGAFCAGGSLTTLEEPTAYDMRRLYRASLRMIEAIRSCPRPVIAAVNGAAAGGGNELIMACDLAVAARSATFGQTGPKVGSAPVTGATNVLSVQIGEKRAKEMAMLCRRYDSTAALDMGLVNKVVEDSRLVAEVEAWCDEIEALSPRYLEITKVNSNLWWNSAKDSFSNGLGMLVQAIGSEDMIEGANAFLEKRKPKFKLSEDEGEQNSGK